MTIIRAPRVQRDFTILANSVCLDKRLTMRALGVLVRLLCRPDNWRTNSEGLAAEFDCGRDAVRGALHELQKAGYIRMQKTQGANGQWSSAWLVFDEPQTEGDFTDAGKTDAGLADAGKTDAGKPGPITRTDEPRTDETRTDVAKEPRKRSNSPSAPEDVQTQVWADWLQLRKAKKAPVTDTVIQGARAEAIKAGMTLTEFLTEWCNRGSQGLKAEWITPQRSTGPESFRERDERIAAESVRRLTGGLAHNRAAVGEAQPRELLPFERGYVKPTDTIEGDADVRRIR